MLGSPLTIMFAGFLTHRFPATSTWKRRATGKELPYPLDWRLGQWLFTPIVLSREKEKA